MTAAKDLSRAAVAAANLNGSGPLELDDVADPAALVARLRDQNDAVGMYLLRRFTDAGRALVQAYDVTEAPPPSLLQVVIDELNRLLADDDDLWGPEFAGVSMPEEIRKRLQRRSTLADRAWKNRFRLELALPKELERRPVNRLEVGGAKLFLTVDRSVYEATIKQRMSRLELLSIIDDDARGHLWEPVLIRTHFAAILEVQKAVILRRANHGALVVAGLLLLTMPLLAWRLGGRPSVSIGDVAQVFFYVMATMYMLVVIGALVAVLGWLDTRLLLHRLHNIRYYAVAFVSWPGLVMAYSAFRARTLLSEGTLDSVFVAAGVMAADGLWLVCLAWFALREGSSRTLDRWFEDDHADAVVVDGLLTCLTLLDGKGEDWPLDMRKQVADQLEKVAVCIERVFPRRFEGRVGGDPWVAQTAREIAFAVRKLKRWVATPFVDTAEQLVARLRTDLLHAAAGAWGHFERCLEEPQPPVPAVSRVRQLVAGGARTVVIAALPLVAVWVAGVYGLSEPLRTQLIVSAGAWAVLTILLYVDPGSARQLAALRDALPHGKGKE